MSSVSGTACGRALPFFPFMRSLGTTRKLGQHIDFRLVRVRNFVQSATRKGATSGRPNHAGGPSAWQHGEAQTPRHWSRPDRPTPSRRRHLARLERGRRRDFETVQQSRLDRPGKQPFGVAEQIASLWFCCPRLRPDHVAHITGSDLRDRTLAPHRDQLAGGRPAFDTSLPLRSPGSLSRMKSPATAARSYLCPLALCGAPLLLFIGLRVDAPPDQLEPLAGLLAGPGAGLIRR